MSKLSPRASNGFYQSLGNKTSPCSTGENEVISDCKGVETKPCLFPSSFFYLQSKSFMTLEKENNRSSCPETPGRDPPFWGRSRSETKLTLGRDRNPPGPSVQFSSVTQSCPALCDPMDCSKPGFPVHHQLPESTQIHIH